MSNPDVAKRVGGQPAQASQPTQAVVLSFNTHGEPPTCTIRLQGDETPVQGVRYFSHYAPTAGDVVWVLWNGSDPMINGKLA